MKKVFHTANGEIEVSNGRVVIRSTSSEPVSETVDNLLKNQGMIRVSEHQTV
jgi:hypothetical protein